MQLLVLLVMVLPLIPSVFCQWKYRLGGGNSTRGRLEIQVTANGPYGTVCKDGFDSNDATVACASLNITGGSVFFPANNVFGSTTLSVLRTNFQCLGNERALSQCMVDENPNCNHSEDIAITCTGVINVEPTSVPPDFATLPPITCSNNNKFVRLVGGSDSTNGRVEIRYKDEWGTICDNLWTQDDAKVVCKMLCNSDSNAQAIIRSQFPSGGTSTKIWLDGVQCTGTEDSVDKCPHWGWANTTRCSHKKDAGVICAPPGSLPANPLQPIISCTEDHIIATLNKAKYPDLTTNLIRLLNNATAECNDAKENSTDIWLTIPFVGCNTLKKYNTTHITYWNTILRQIPPTTLITRQSQYTVEVNCDVLRSRTDSDPIKPVNIVAEPVSGNSKFNVGMFVFNPVDNKPVVGNEFVLKLGDMAGAAMFVKSKDNELRLILPDCFAAPTAVVDANTKTYPLITNKCRVDDTVTIRVINSTAMGFTFQSFVFMDASGTTTLDNLYLHCTGVVCGMHETSKFCDPTCDENKRRRKRDVTSAHSDVISDIARYKRSVKDDGNGLTVVQKTEGPFIIRHNNQNEGAKFNGILHAKTESQTPKPAVKAPPGPNPGTSFNPGTNDVKGDIHKITGVQNTTPAIYPINNLIISSLVTIVIALFIM